TGSPGGLVSMRRCPHGHPEGLTDGGAEADWLPGLEDFPLQRLHGRIIVVMLDLLYSPFAAAASFNGSTVDRPWLIASPGAMAPLTRIDRCEGAWSLDMGAVSHS